MMYLATNLLRKTTWLHSHYPEEVLNSNTTTVNRSRKVPICNIKLEYSRSITHNINVIRTKTKNKYYTQETNELLASLKARIPRVWIHRKKSVQKVHRFQRA